MKRQPARHTIRLTGPVSALLAGLAGLALSTAVAREEIEEVVVVGTYLENASFRAGTQLEIDHGELEASMPAESEQLMRRLPGLSVYRPGGPGGVSEVFLRGAESNFTAVFLDGVRLNNPANTRGGSFDFSMLTVNEIRRVGIAMGAMSAIYGSDAMAGVIWIESAWPEAGSREAYMEAGTESDWRAGTAATFAVGGSASLGLRLNALDGGDQVEGSNRELLNVSARLAGQRRNGDRWWITLRHADRERTSFPEVSGGPELALLRDLETADGEDLSVSAMLEWSLSGNWDAEIIASWAELDDTVFTPPVPAGVLDAQPAFSSISEYRRGQLLWINRLAVGARSRLAFGLDLVDEEGRDEGAVDLGFAVVPGDYRLDRLTASAFLELGTRWSEGLGSTAAVRVDASEEESRLSGKIELTKELQAGKARLWARAANGFKLPSFFALANPLVGNPALVSEKVRSLEVGYDRMLADRVRLEMSLFANEYEDLVDFDFEKFINVNRGEVDIDGIHFRVQADMTPEFSLGADLTRSRIRSATGPLRRRPETTGGVDLSWRPAASWSVYATARYVGERFNTSIPTGDLFDDGYIIVDAIVRHRHSESLDFWFAVDNVFDAEYQDAPGFPAPGPRARLGAELRF